MNTATILIPDISGFTEFMTSTELSHGSQAINMLIDAIVAPIENEYEVAEIEGDAVLMIRKGPAPSKKEICDTCVRIFNSFHAQRQWIQKHSVCPCGACVSIGDLTVKFVVHHGPVAEIKVGRFVKQSGTDLIVAHRLLKNSIDNHEYLLITDKLLNQVADSADAYGMDWTSSAEQYNSIGKVDFQFANLKANRYSTTELRNQNDYPKDQTTYQQIPINANFRDVYMMMMNIPGRSEWLPGLTKVEQPTPNVHVGSMHQCSFENYQCIVSPLNMVSSENSITYAESLSIPGQNVSLIHEYIFQKLDDNNSLFQYRSMNQGSAPIPASIESYLGECMQKCASALKELCEKMQTSFFKPAFQTL